MADILRALPGLPRPTAATSAWKTYRAYSTNRLRFNRISGSASARNLRRPTCTTKQQRRLIMKHTRSLRISSLCKLASALGLAVILLSFGAILKNTNPARDPSDLFRVAQHLANIKAGILLNVSVRRQFQPSTQKARHSGRQTLQHDCRFDGDSKPGLRE